MFLPPGTYDVRFSAAGYTPAVARVTVTGTSAVTLDVPLAPAPAPPVERLVFFDDFEIDRCWRPDLSAVDTAVTGRWERGDPQSTSSSGAKQLGATVSGVHDLVTGRLAGTSAGAHDIDGGRTSILSPAIQLPNDGALELSFHYYLAHTSTSSSADYLRITVVGSTSAVVLEERGDANDDDAVWEPARYDLSAFAGQSVRIRVEAADEAAGSIVEAAVDDVTIVQR